MSEKLASVTGRYERESQEIIQLHDLAQLATSGVLSESKEIGYMINLYGYRICVDILTGKNLSSIRLLWGSFIGQFVHPAGRG